MPPAELNQNPRPTLTLRTRQQPQRSNSQLRLQQIQTRISDKPRKPTSRPRIENHQPQRIPSDSTPISLAASSAWTTWPPRTARSNRPCADPCEVTNTCSRTAKGKRNNHGDPVTPLPARHAKIRGRGCVE